MMIYACITQQLCDRYDELRDFRLDLAKNVSPIDVDYYFALFEDTYAVGNLA